MNPVVLDKIFEIDVKLLDGKRPEVVTRLNRVFKMLVLDLFTGAGPGTCTMGQADVFSYLFLNDRTGRCKLCLERGLNPSLRPQLGWTEAPIIRVGAPDVVVMKLPEAGLKKGVHDRASMVFAEV